MSITGSELLAKAKAGRKKEQNGSDEAVKRQVTGADIMAGARRLKRYDALDTSGVNADYLSGFVTDAQGFVSDMRGDTPVTLAQAKARAEDLNTRYDTIQAHLYKNKGSMTAEDYEGYSKALEGLSELGGIADFYGQFASEEDFSAWLTNDRFERETMGLEDFEEFSGIGAGIGNPSLDEIGTKVNGRYWLTDAADGIGNIVTYAKSLPEQVAAEKMSHQNRYGVPMSVYNYRYMNDNEVAIYNYYLGKGETAKAAEYLATLEEKLKERRALDIHESVTGSRFLEMVNAFDSGLENFAYGIGNLDNWFRGGDPDPLSATQYASSMIRNDVIRDDGTGGGWGIAYDLTSTTANMLPSILVSYIPVVGQAAGLVSMGAAATGNAYAEMKRLGYNDGQARGYSLAVGVSEAALQRILGGISKLSGGNSKGIFQSIAGKVLPKIDNALARIAIDLGSNMLDEGVEEALQSVLEPLFAALFTNGEAFEGIDLEEVIYSGLLGMLSAGVLEGLPTVIGNVEASRVYKQARELYGNGVESALIAEALALNPDSRLAQKLKARLDKERKVSGAELYALLQENRAAIKKAESGEAVAHTEDPAEGIAAELPAEDPAETVAESPTEAAGVTPEEERADGDPAPEIAAEESHGAEETVSEASSVEYVADGLTAEQVAPRFRAMGEAGMSVSDAVAEAKESGILWKDRAISDEAMSLLTDAWTEGSAVYAEKQKPAGAEANVQDPTEDARKASEKAENEAVTTTDGAYTITERDGQMEVSFEDKPSETVRNTLKGLGFRWDSKRKLWYGKADRSKVEEALREAYGQETLTQTKTKRADTSEMNTKIFTSEFARKSLSSFGITNPSDYVHVQKRIMATLEAEGFFTDENSRSRTETNAATGMVIEINRSGIDESFNLDNYIAFSNDKRIAKIATVRMLPQIIRDAVLIADRVPSSHSKNDPNKKFAYLRGTAAVDGIPVELKISVKQSPQKNKFWVHTVYLSVKENIDGQGATPETGREAPNRTADGNTIIPQNPEMSSTSAEKNTADAHEAMRQELNRRGLFETDGYVFRVSYTAGKHHGTIHRSRDGKYSRKASDTVYATSPHDTHESAVEDLVEYAKRKKLLGQTTESAKKDKTVTTKKTDWQAHDVEWRVPGKKKPIAYSSKATSDLIKALTEENPSATIREIFGKVNYDAEAKRVLQQYMDAGLGGQVAYDWFVQPAENRGDRSDNARNRSDNAEDRSDNAEDRSVKANADSPSMQVAAYFLDRFRAGVYPNKKVLEEKCAKAFGGTLAEGAYTPKDAYDALELAVNLYLKELARDFNTDDSAGAVLALSRLEELVGNLPTQTNRTAEQERFQQFSTPPTIAYLAAWAANVKASDVVLEPSAGIGGLAVYPQTWGAQVAVNELDERRRAVLSHMGFDTITGEDARYIQDVPALAGVSPSVVLMNPPFSSQATTGMAANTSTSFEHVEAALEKLTDGGRLVTVLGAGRDGVDSKQFTAWMRELKKDYTIRANVVIDGKNYRKYGTDFNVRIVVIDKVGAHTGETVTGTFTKLDELPGKLKGVRDARESGRAGLESYRGLASHTGGVHADPRVSGDERAVGDAHAGAGVPVDGGSVGVHDGTHGGGREPAAGGAVSGAHDAARRGDGGVERSRSRGTGRSGEPDPDRVRAGAGSPAADHAESGRGDAGQLRGVDQRRGNARAEDVTAPASESAPAPAKDYKAGTSKKKAKDTGVYADYVAPALPVKGLKAHPAVLVESSAMASVQAPKATYKPHLSQESINRGVWSGEQMVNIVYAGQAHAQTLPNGTRKGYLIGDGTGVGKGRQIAGIIMDNLAQGRKRAVWVSNNSPLYEDAIRDWTAVGGDKADVMLYERSKADKRAGSDGILFTTYSTLGAKPNKTSKDKTTNLDKIVAWLGEDFDGVIAFDEAHNMANAIPKKGGWGQQKPAAKALAGLELQRRLPKARIVYVSATAATSVGELAYAERLGLWGDGTAFRDRETFLDKLMQAGTAGMELVARDMKAMGVYNARSISYDGVQYDTLRHKLTRQQKDMYDKMSDAWQIVMQNVENAMVVTGANKDGKARGRYLSGLYGSLQRFYQQILCSLSMPSVIEDIRRELDAGHSCVLQIVNTNEAQENRTKAAAKETDSDLEELDFSPRNILIDYLMNAFPITRYEEYKDEDGNVRAREVKDANGNPVISQKAVAMRDDLISQIEALSIPDNPLDMLYRAFGVDNVAEITGRSSRVVPLPDENGEMHLVDQKRGKAASSADVEAFQNGDKRILVFSDAGGTGKSYHADRAAKNQQKRIHYLIQPGWNATKAVQGFGRTHRSNQVSAPTYKLVTTDIAGQARFISTIAKRLDNLGAMTKGQRQAGSGFFSAADNLESDLAAQTLFTFYKMLDRGAYHGFSGRETIRKLGLERKLYTHEGYLNVESSDMMDVSLFLNRVLSLRFDEQNALFGHFVDLLTQFTEEAEAKGELDMGMENVRADRAELVDEKIIREYENGGEPTRYLRIKTYTKAKIETSAVKIGKIANDFVGIYRDTKGNARAIFKLADRTTEGGLVTKRYRVQTPNVGRYSVIDGATFAKYTRVLSDEAQAAWDEAVAATPEYDVRGAHMVTGALLPIWDRLSDANIKVQRITLDSGERYLGRVINQTQADQLLRQFGQSRKAEKLTGEQIVNTVIGEGHVVSVEKMYSNYDLTRARVSGENRIEIVGKRRQQAMYDMAGVIEEKIGSEYRYFIPVGEKGAAMLDGLIRNGARVSVKEESGTEGLRARRSVSSVEAQKQRATVSRDESEWTPTEVPDGTETVERADVVPVSLSELTSLIQERFGVHITVGHLRTRGTDGEYDAKTGGMRIKLANDLPVIAHELGHHLEREFGLGDFEERNRSVLESVLSPEMRDAYKEEFRASEGFAEFLRRYLLDRDGAELEFGRDAEGKSSETSLFYQFEAALNDKTLSDLREVSDLVYALLNDTSVSSAKALHRQKSHMETFFTFTSAAARALRDKEYRGELLTDAKDTVRASITEQTRILREGVTAQDIGKSWYARFMTRWVDRNYLLYEIGRASGNYNAEAYVYAQNAAYAGGVAFANAVDTELCDIDGKVVGESLGAILKPLYTQEHKGERLISKMDYTKFDAFNEYLLVRHAPERMAEGMKIFGNPRLDTPEYCETRQAELEAEYPEFSDMAMRLYEFQTSMLRTWAVQTGIVSASMADEWGKRWNNYVPLQRVMDDKINARGRGAKKSFASQKSPWHRAVGSTRDIVAPVDSIVTTLTNLVSISHRNRVMLSLTKTLKSMPDSSFLMEKIPAHVKRETVDTTAAKDSMLEDMMENGMDGELSMAIMELVNKYFDDTMERFTRKAKPGEPDEITVLRGGRAELWQVNNRELFEVVAGLQGETRNGILKLFEKLTRFQVGALTGNNLAWSLRSNIFRDIQAAGTYLMGDIDYLSRDGIKTVHKEVARRWVSLIQGYGKSFVSSFRDTYGHGSEDVYWKEMMAQGGSDAALWASDKRASLRVQKEIEKSVATKLSPFRFVSCVSEAIEKGPRYAAYKLYRQSGAEPSYAFYRAIDLTVNFKRGGTVSKDVTKVIPFFNASVQGIDRMVRYYTGQQIDENMQVVHGEARKQLIKQRAVLTLVSTVIGVALAQILRQMDKDDYDRLSTYTKNNFWCIPIPGSHRFITIPKPRELTVLQSGLERGLDYILGDPHAYDEFGEYAIGTLAPPVVSDILQIPSDGLEDATFGALSSIGIIGPAVEIYANKNFLGQPIIPSYLEDVLPEDQYKQSTSVLAYWLGNTALGRGWGLSPVGIDHFGESVLGGYWELHKSLLPLNGDYRDVTVGFGSSIVRNSAYSTDVANRLYDGREAAMLESNSDPENMEKKITYKWYDTAASFYSRYGKLAKATEDEEQAEDDRLRALEHVQSFLSVMESGDKVAGQAELEAYVRATGDTSVMPGVMQTFIKYGEDGTFDRELDLDAEGYIEFQGKYNTLYWQYASKALSGSLSEEQQGEALQAAKDQALIEAKNYILGLHGYSSKRYRQTTGYDTVKSAGVSLTDYAKVRVFWREAEADRDRNGKTVSGSKRDKVAEYINSLRISDRKKDALYLAMGYSESSLSEVPWH